MSDRFEDTADFVVTQCCYCRHANKTADPPTCTAYPSGIPDAILTNRADHRKPQPGDHGIRFEADTGVGAAALARLNEALDKV
jgi:hypothetical protein